MKLQLLSIPRSKIQVQSSKTSKSNGTATPPNSTNFIIGIPPVLILMIRSFYGQRVSVKSAEEGVSGSSESPGRH